MNWRRLAAALAAFSSLLLAPINATAAPVVRENFRVQLTEVGQDPCANNDTVVVTETLHFVILVNADGAGGFHVDTVTNIEDGTGTDLVTGVTYVATGSNATSFQIKPPFPAVSTIEVTSVLVSRGGTPNLLNRILIHFTVNANGTVTATIFSFDTMCAG